VAVGAGRRRHDAAVVWHTQRPVWAALSHSGIGPTAPCHRCYSCTECGTSIRCRPITRERELCISLSMSTCAIRIIICHFDPHAGRAAVQMGTFDPLSFKLDYCKRLAGSSVHMLTTGSTLLLFILLNLLRMGYLGFRVQSCGIAFAGSTTCCWRGRWSIVRVQHSTPGRVPASSRPRPAQGEPHPSGVSINCAIGYPAAM
jgi:hypothetical protein